MKLPHLPLDEHDLRARLLPALVITFPALAFFYGMLPAMRGFWGGVSGSVLESAVLGVLMRIGRDRGARLQTRLYEKWGGKPTTILLRHSDRHLDGHTKERYKKVLGQMSGLEMPTASQEEADPAAADAIYESCVKVLMEKRRGKPYRLIFLENCNYGFVRNLVGLKSIGFALVGATLLVDAVLYLRRAAPVNGLTVSVTVSILTGVVLSLLTVNSVWRSGLAYAEALLRTCDSARTGR
jgi:hypothetical protein